MAGTASWMARTTAKPMMWVKETFPPRERPRYPLMIFRLTSRSLAGTTRKLVAVGTPRLASMFSTMRAATPRMGSPGASGAGALASALALALAVAVAGASAAGFAGSAAGAEPAGAGGAAVAALATPAWGAASRL